MIKTVEAEDHPEDERALKPRVPSSSRSGRPARSGGAELALAPELDQALGFHLRRAVSFADALFAEIFAPVEITTQHYAILMSIRHNPGCQPSALSALLNITPNNLVPHIDVLVARGYIRRTSSRKDRRIKHLRLTPAGEDFAQLLVGRHEEVRSRVEERIGTQNVAKLLDLLKLYSG